MPYQPPLLQTPQHRAPKLPFQPSGDDLATRRVLALLWPLCEPSMPRTTTVAAWRARNKRAALEIARTEANPDEIRAAHERASERLGGRCWSVAIVRDELLRAHEEPEAVPVARAGIAVATPDFLAGLR